MLRAGMIRKVAAGVYTWLPLGLKVLRKVEAIVREEMNSAGALGDIDALGTAGRVVAESGRWAQYGPELLRMKDRHDREFCYGPTHEEIITDLARRELKSYKQLPGEFLSDPDQIPRRGTPALRRHACTRVSDEGRLFLPQQSGPRWTKPIRSCSTPTRASSRGWG